MPPGSSSKPAPSGTRDVLPDEMAELRAMTRAMIDCLDARGYGEVRTPTLEYERAMPGAESGPPAAYRLIDEHGDSLVLRPDMTLPIARIATTRYGQDDLPLRFCYLARSWRRVKPRSGEAREVLQLGGELIGADDSDSVTEILGLLSEVLERSGLRDWRIAIGHAGIPQSLLDAAGIPADGCSSVLEALDAGDIVGLRAAVGDSPSGFGPFGLADALVLRRPANGFDRDLIEGAPGPVVELADTVASLPEGLRDRMIVDLSLRPRIGYYEGIVFEVYDPAVGRALGGGGRYDALLKLLGRDTTAVGFGLDAELVHAAVAGEQRGEGISP